MSERVCMVAPYLSQLETGKRPVLPRHIKAYERALGVEGLADDMDRRALLRALAATTAGEPLTRLLDGLVAPAESGQVGRIEVSAVREAARHHSAMDLQYGGNVAAGVAGESLRWAVSLLDRPMTSETRKALSSAVASLSDRVAWSFHDAGLKYQTRRLSELAIRTSNEGDDPTLTAHVRLNISSFMETRPIDAASVLTGLYQDTRVHSLERANVAAVRARHVGNAGESREARNLLGLAEDLICKEYPDGVPSWAGFLSIPHLCQILGDSYNAIGDYDRAASYFQQSLRGFGPERGRGRVTLMVRLGLVRLAQGRVEDARAQADAARRAMATVNSVRARESLDKLTSRLDVLA
ncbi:tetratricopeptide (TPR) repeat protein [Saccharopolyspora phatthalungensis]|uniref:Tetratricopeptide (TPR) repeat protein n=2 Tax=Saccharopolyspora phatthalungensis TaxID=664693 RepID=A0A840QHK1_9PSEU|nr:tetratricopeptide (TPR) repeat protein [Saccharopolyspora phatthalungensis]